MIVSIDESRCHGKLFDITIVVLICCAGDWIALELSFYPLPSRDPPRQLKEKSGVIGDEMTVK